jgi:hypothetical protein
MMPTGRSSTVFLLDERIDHRRVQPLPPSGGWKRVRDEFLSRLPDMTRYPNRHVLLIIDCDGQVDRIDSLLPDLAADVRDRVFVFGAQFTPERLSAAMQSSKETIGRRLARDCAKGTDEAWSHDHLRHNQG